MSILEFGDEPSGTGSLLQFAAFGAPGMAVLWIGGTLLATVRYPSFDWTTDALAEVGRTGAATAPLFDASLFVGSLFGLVFLGYVGLDKTDPIQRVGLGLMGVLIFLVGAGQLGNGQPLFLIVVLSVLFGVPLGMAVYATGEVRAGNPLVGVLTFWIGLLHLLNWSIVSDLLGFSSAIPTYGTIVLLALWVLLLYRDRTQADAATSQPRF